MGIWENFHKNRRAIKLMFFKMAWTHTPIALAAVFYLIKCLVMDGQVCHLFE